MAIGANWAEVWKDVWKSVWTQSAPEPEPEAEPSQTPAGRKTKRRYYVEIDGETFPVENAEHARSLLDRARELAQAHAEQLAKQVVKPKKGTKPVALPTPAISSPNPELKQVVSEARIAINAVYRSAAIDAELALLFLKAAEEDDETVLLLM